MGDNQLQSQGSSSEPMQTAPDKKPGKTYQRPRILSREPLEAMAVTCSQPLGKPATGICNTAMS